MPDNAAPHPSASALERILGAAERLFAERGFDSVSISDVAREAGVCKANVFHHFAGKQALYEAVLAGSCARLGDEMERMLAADAGAAEQIPHFLHWYRRYLREHPATARLLLRELTGNLAKRFRSGCHDRSWNSKRRAGVYRSMVPTRRIFLCSCRMP